MPHRISEHQYATKKSELDAYRRELMNRAVQVQVSAASVQQQAATPSAPVVPPTYTYTVPPTAAQPIPDLL